VAAAVALGLFAYFIGKAGQQGTRSRPSSGPASARSRTLSLWALMTRAPIRLERSALPAVAGLGLLDTAANGLFVLASARGYLSIVSVLGSLYPVATILAAPPVPGRAHQPRAARRASRSPSPASPSWRPAESKATE